MEYLEAKRQLEELIKEVDEYLIRIEHIHDHLVFCKRYIERRTTPRTTESNE